MSQNENHIRYAFTPREGQRELIEHLPHVDPGQILSVQWPTGYGKSIGFALTWKHCHENGIANRLLLVVANETQLRQVENDFAGDCDLVGAPSGHGVWVIDSSAADLCAARRGNSIIYACTVQKLDASNRGGLNVIRDILTTPGTRWMIGFDEYHHYGEGMSWGDSAKAFMRHSCFTIAMSATPYRRGVDTIFPQPDLSVTYTKAAEAKSVKPIICQAYEYKVTVRDGDGKETEYTTSELMEQAPEGLSAWEERRHIRYASEFVHPLIVQPLDRLNTKSAKSCRRLQMLVRAMSCSHARMVCEQISAWSGGLSVDWVGTGANGRTDEENRKVLNRFCPPKINGERPQPELDILVQVNMAGEGFDSINVAEIVDLFPVSMKAENGRATQDKQFYGRGARIIRGAEDIKLHVNVPSDHPLSQWGGLELNTWMDAFGGIITPPDETQEREPSEIDLFDFPDPPTRRDVELINVSRDEEGFTRFKQVLSAEGINWESDEDRVFDWYLKCRHKEAAQLSEKALIQKHKDYIDPAIGRLAAIRVKKQHGKLPSDQYRTLIGKKKYELNALTSSKFGSRDKFDLTTAEQCAKWVRGLIDQERTLL